MCDPIRVWNDYYLDQWTQPDSRSRVGVICTIGPKVFARDGQVNRIPELVSAGMNIARINLSHYSLVEGGPIHKRRLRELFSITREIRSASDGQRRLVNIMLDLKGPEFRTASFKVPRLDSLVSSQCVTLGEGTILNLLSAGDALGCHVTGPVLVLGGVELPQQGPAQNRLTITLHDTYANLTVHRPLPGGILEMTVDSSSLQPPSLKVGDPITLSIDGSDQPASVSSIYDAALDLKRLRGDTLHLYPTTQKDAGDHGDGHCVIYVEYDGDLLQDVGRQAPSDSIFAENGKVAFQLGSTLRQDSTHAVVRVSYGSKIGIRKSLNLFNNPRRSCEFVSYADSDERYISALVRMWRDEGFEGLPFDSIAVSFTRKAQDLLFGADII